jgi:hypothetical protein
MKETSRIKLWWDNLWDMVWIYVLIDAGQLYLTNIWQFPSSKPIFRYIQEGDTSIIANILVISAIGLFWVGLCNFVEGIWGLIKKDR